MIYNLQYGINISCLILGLINTDDIKKRNNIDWTKLLQPEDVANSIMFLASGAGCGYEWAAPELFGDYQ